jgi:hypothetical protein
LVKLTFSNTSIGLKRISYIAKLPETVSANQLKIEKLMHPGIALGILLQLYVRIYEHRSDLRSSFRHLLVKYLLTVNISSSSKHRKPLNDSASSTKNTTHKSPALDGGQGRSHVAPLLKILHTIIAGLPLLLSPQTAQYEIRYELLVNVLLPLHLPNEMIEWRDQIPIIQQYHEELVRCVVTLIEKTYTNITTDHDHSLLLIIFIQLLHHWPEAFNTNTPKQVLLLHELEILLERMELSRFISIQTMFLVSHFNTIVIDH